MDALHAVVDWFERNGRASPRSSQWPDRSGEYSGLCPFHDDQKLGNFHFSEKGYKCFACPAKGSINRLARKTAKIFEDLPFTFVERKPWEPPVWATLDYTAAYGFIPEDALAYYKKRGFNAQSIRNYRLGYGVLPEYTSSCRHNRLIIPVFEDGQLVSLKGREFDPACDCDKKWAFAKGSKPVLFNADLLKYVQNRGVVIVTEAPYSCILSMQDEPGFVTVASSGGANTWLSEWTDAIVEAKPRHVYLWFDNDDAGAEWAEIIGFNIAGKGVPTSIFVWPPGLPEHYDLADYRKGHDIRLALHNSLKV